ncbi:sensor histidine kinase [Candidatus Parcubacteria bacterium]|nr:sensor histidine kinase [Candidatus Parcubacteria bacterium]
MKEKLQFKISAALKNIIGKELITDQYIAIFELVKNSFDAYATRVDVDFLDDKIIVKDNGKGMNIDDIKNKWLFVGYSAKADDTENIGYNNYRNKIKTRRVFAGAKGVGRFACDRLGKKLKLISIKEEKNPKIEQIIVEWELFEKDSKEDFIDISVTHEILAKNPYSKIKHGTILEISELREKWADGEDGEKERLGRHLSKLINPIEKNIKDKFDIFIDNKKIKNGVFKKLVLKTTQIIVDVSKDGSFITTELIDRGEKIYKIKEKNKWKDHLFNIQFQLFYLSTPTKISFYHHMGMRVNDFGSIFLYKNGFRVFPYGEAGDDSLGIDKRKQQGYARYIGTREVVGFIDINNESDEFKETTSRDGGLIETMGVKSLRFCFEEKALRRLESYVIDALDWTYKRDIQKEFYPEEKEEEIRMLIKKLTKSKDFLDLKYSRKFLQKIEEKTKQGFQGATEQLKKEAQKTGDKRLLKEVKKIEETQKRQKNIIKAQENKIEKSEEQSSALRNLIENPFFKNIVDFHHDISIASENIDDSLDDALVKLTKKDYKNLGNILEIVKFENSKIFSISKIATRSGMRDGVHKKRMALNKKITSYLKEYNLLYSSLNIKTKDSIEKDFVISFRYYDLVTVLDNLLDNSKKHKAKNIEVIITNGKKWLEMSFLDDGKGIDKKFANNPDDIFKSRTSTTKGAGWGLYQIKEILKEMNGDISVSPQKKGLLFNIHFKK